VNDISFSNDGNSYIRVADEIQKLMDK
ncbi:uncharacterized protein METZ01_LOCUS350277, partial [marine metagenome]